MAFNDFLMAYSAMIGALALAIALAAFYMFYRRFSSRVSGQGHQHFEPMGHRVGEVREVSVLKCQLCGNTFTRQFRQGDYVGKVEDERCPNDNGQLIIYSIYVEKLMPR